MPRSKPDRYDIALRRLRMLLAQQRVIGALLAQQMRVLARLRDVKD